MLRTVLGAVLASVAMLAPVPAAPTVPTASTATTAVPAPGSAPALCRDAARLAAVRHGIPVEMMQAITLVETRRKVGGVSGPWPWTLNIDGNGYWFDTRDEALANAEREIANGRLSVDLGCFQLNYRWHGGNFNSPDEMLDPALAADYAARFLGKLFAETGDWMRAAGRYHSRTPVYAQRYRSMIGRALASLDGAPVAPQVAISVPSAAAAKPGPRPAQPSRAQPARTRPLYAIVLATARADSDPAFAAAPGAVMLRMFARPARPLLATPGIKP
jgi:hypothetical protein